MRRLSKAAKLLVQQLEELPRPEGISKTKWRGVRALLIAIGKHYPKAFPSQVTLAAETGYDVRSIQRYQATAVEFGLLLVKPDAGRKGEHNSWSKTNRYHITIGDKLSSMSDDSLSSKPYGLRPTGIELRSITSVEVISLSADGLPPGERARQVGEAPGPPRRSKMARPKSADELVVDSGRRQPRRQPKRSVVKWAVATEHFAQAWQAMIESLPANDRLRQVRAMETRGHCRSYFDSQFFGPQALTPKPVEEVCALIDQFVALAARRSVKIKEDQSAWMCFTGAWGRKTRRYHNEQYSAANYELPPLEQ